MERPKYALFKYMGSKWRIAPWVISHFPPHKCYAEPFGGGGAVLLNKPRASAELYNDIRDDIVTVFRVMRDPKKCEELRRQLYYTPYSKTEYYAAFDDPVDKDEEPVEFARRMIVRASQGFGALGATRKSPAGWARVGVSDSNEYRNYAGTFSEYIECLEWYCARLRGVHIDNTDAFAVIDRLDVEGNLIYCDPPYMPETWLATSGYGEFNFPREKHEELLQRLLKCKAHVVLSGYDNDLYNDALDGWEKAERKTSNCLHQERTEVLWISPSATESRDFAMGRKGGFLFE